MTTSAKSTAEQDGTVGNASARRQPRPVILLVPVPGNSPIHQLWAGTKLLVVFGLSVLLTFFPGWITIAAVGALMLMSTRVAGITRGVLPTIPRWLWILVFVGGVTAALAGGAPTVSAGGLVLGLGGLLKFLRITALTVVLLGLGGLISWTTNVSEVAPAVAALTRPLRFFRIPVEEWAVTLALALRAFPLLIDEFQVLYAARRLRPKPVPTGRRARRRQRWAEAADLLAAAFTVTLRRADEMGDAITARGGAGQLTAHKERPKKADWIVLGATVLLSAVAVTLELFLRTAA